MFTLKHPGHSNQDVHAGLRERISQHVVDRLSGSAREWMVGAANTHSHNPYRTPSKKFNPNQKLYRKTKRNEQAERFAGRISGLPSSGAIASGILRSSKTGQVLDRIAQRFKAFTGLQLRWPTGHPLGGQWKPAGGSAAKSPKDVMQVGGGFSTGKEVVDSISKAHKLPVKYGNVRIKEGGRATGIEGRYDPILKNITIYKTTKQKALTTAHELGHSVACQALSSCNMSGPRFKDLRRSIQNSRSFQRWKEAERTGIIPLGKLFRGRVSPQFMRYFVSDREVFARAYAQYIGQKSGNRSIMDDLARENKTPWPRQWKPEEFGPIQVEFDRLFEAEGLKP